MNVCRLTEIEAAVARYEADLDELADALQLVEKRFRDLHRRQEGWAASSIRQSAGAHEGKWRHILLVNEGSGYKSVRLQIVDYEKQETRLSPRIGVRPGCEKRYGVTVPNGLVNVFVNHPDHNDLVFRGQILLHDRGFLYRHNLGP